MGAAFDNQFRCENPRLFDAFPKLLLHTLRRVRASDKGEVAHECIS